MNIVKKFREVYQKEKLIVKEPLENSGTQTESKHDSKSVACQYEPRMAQLSR